MSDREAQALLAYFYLFDIDCMLRPPTLEKTRLYRYLEDGATGLMIPHVSTAEKARMLVDAVKFPPIGDRGLDGAGLDSDFILAGGEDYIEAANRETLVCVQLEEEAAIHNAEEILAVDHVDVFFVGPADLSQSMGHPGNPGAPAVRDAIDSTFRKIVGAGKIAGTSANTGAIRETLGKGVLYTYTHVTDLLGTAAEAFFRAAQPC